MRTRLAFMTLIILAALAPVDLAVAQAPRRTLVIGMPVTPPNLPHIGVYIAKELGYFDEEGITVDVAGFESGLQSLRGGVAGGVDILRARSEPVIRAITRGATIRSIFSYSHRLTVVMVAQESIRRPADLRGKNLGIQEVGAFREVMTQAVLRSAGPAIAPPDSAEIIAGPSTVRVSIRGWSSLPTSNSAMISPRKLPVALSITVRSVPLPASIPSASSNTRFFPPLI